MNSVKGLVPILVCSGIVAVAYLAVAFLIPFLWTPSYWVAFGFGWLAIFIAILSNVYVVNAASERGTLYRSSLGAVSVIYLIIAAAVSLGFMAIATAPIWLVVLVQILLAAICVTVLLLGAHGVSYIEATEAQTQQQTSFIKDLRTQVNSLVPLAATPASHGAITSLAEALRFTDPVSNPALATIDQEIAGLVAVLREALMTHNDEVVVALCAQVKSAVERRAAIAIATNR